ncbi:hypothetical protein [Halocola ammonii]
MNQEEAVKIFQLDDVFDRDDMQDAYEESFFSTRDYFLKNTVVPQLFISRLQRLKKFEEAFCFLSNKNFGWSEPKLKTPPGLEEAAKMLGLHDNSLERLLKSYEVALTEKRMFLAQSWTIPEVVKNTLQVVEVQQAYHVLFEKLGEAELHNSQLDLDEVKASQQVDSGLLLQQMNKRDSSESDEIEFQKLLAREVARVKKLNRLLKSSSDVK